MTGSFPKPPLAAILERAEKTSEGGLFSTRLIDLERLAAAARSEGASIEEIIDTLYGDALVEEFDLPQAVSKERLREHLTKLGYGAIRMEEEPNYRVSIRARKTPDAPRSFLNRVVISTDHDPRYSRGIVAREMAHALRKRGIESALEQFFDAGLHPLPEGVAYDVDLNPGDLFVRFDRLGSAGAKEDKARGGRRWGYFFHEFSHVPKSYLSDLDVYERVAFVSRFCAERALESGLKKQPFVVPHGYDPDVFYPGSDEKSRFKDEFVFLSVARQQRRKGVVELIRAFQHRFKETSDPVRLLIKDVDLTPLDVDYEREVESEKVTLEKGFLDEEALAILYRDADCFVFPSYAEGFGIPALEAKASGLPVIATGWGGHMDFCDSSDTMLIDYDFEPSGFTYLPEVISLWARPRVKHLAELMGAVYEDESLRESLSEKGLRRAKNYAWDASLASFCDAAKKALRS